MPFSRFLTENMDPISPILSFSWMLVQNTETTGWRLFWSIKTTGRRLRSPRSTGFPKIHRGFFRDHHIFPEDTEDSPSAHSSPRSSSVRILVHRGGFHRGGWSGCFSWAINYIDMLVLLLLLLLLCHTFVRFQTFFQLFVNFFFLLPVSCCPTTLALRVYL